MIKILILFSLLIFSNVVLAVSGDPNLGWFLNSIIGSYVLFFSLGFVFFVVNFLLKKYKVKKQSLFNNIFLFLITNAMFLKMNISLSLFHRYKTCSPVTDLCLYIKETVVLTEVCMFFLTILGFYILVTKKTGERIKNKFILVTYKITEFFFFCLSFFLIFYTLKFSIIFFLRLLF